MPVPAAPPAPEEPTTEPAGLDAARPPQPLYLHVGLPKSGTTFLQRMLATNRDALKRAGFIYPFVRREGMFHAAVELREQHARWGLEAEQIDGTWERLLRRARNFGGPAILSHEILAGSRAKTIDRVVESTSDFELHVVITVRDLARQSVAYWQEQVKNGRPWSFADFRRDVADHVGDPASAVDGGGFWRSQDLGSVLEWWGRAVPPERVHVVVVPPSGAPPEALWRRFCEAVGLDPSVASPEDVPRTNASLGTGQIALLRRVNDALDDRLGQPHYAHVVKRFFAQRLLAEVEGGRRPVTPPDLAERFDEVVDRWRVTIEDRGYQVHGDLDELRVGSRAGSETDAGDARRQPPPHPDDVTDAEVLSGVPEVVAGLLLEIAELRTHLEGPRRLPPLDQSHPLRGTTSEDDRLSETEPEDEPQDEPGPDEAQAVDQHD